MNHPDQQGSEENPHEEAIKTLAYRCLQWEDGEIKGYDMQAMDSLLPIIMRPLYDRFESLRSELAKKDEEIKCIKDQLEYVIKEALKWRSVKDGMPELDENVLCLGFKMSPEDRPETAEYDIMHRMYLHNPELTDHKGKPVKYGWSKRWWDTNPDLYGVFYWMPLPPSP